jgi:hypothetical protein
VKKLKLSGKRYSPLPDIYTPIDKTSVTPAVLLIVAVVGVIYFWTDYVTGGVHIVKKDWYLKSSVSQRVTIIRSL